MIDFYEQAVNKVRNKEQDFSEEEIKALIYEGDRVAELEGNDHRWNREITTVIKIDDKLYAIDWRRGLTEMQDDSYYATPYQVKEKTKVVEVTYYEKI